MGCSVLWDAVLLCVGAGVTRWRLISDGPRAASAERLCAQHSVWCGGQQRCATMRPQWVKSETREYFSMMHAQQRARQAVPCVRARTAAVTPTPALKRVGNLGNRGMPRETRRFLVAKTHRTIPARHSRWGRGLSVGGSRVGGWGSNSSSSTCRSTAAAAVAVRKLTLAL